MAAGSRLARSKAAAKGKWYKPSPLGWGIMGFFAVVFALIGFALYSAWEDKRHCGEIFARAADWNDRVERFNLGGSGDYESLLAEERALVDEAYAAGCRLEIR